MDTRVADHAESLVLRKQADRPGARGMVSWAMGWGQEQKLMTEACSWTRELWVAGRLWPSLQEELTVLPILGTAGTLVLKPQGQGFCQ